MEIVEIGSAKTEFSNTSSTSTTVNKPGGSLDGNVLEVGDLLTWTISNQSVTVIPDPAGFIPVWQANATGLSTGVWIRVVDGTEPDIFTHTIPNGRTTSAMRALRGVDQDNPLAGTASSLQGTGVPIFPAINPGVAGAAIFGVAGALSAGGDKHDFTGTNCNRGIVSEVATNANTGANVAQATMRHDWSSGSFTPTVTMAGVPTRRIGITFALRPAPDAPTPTYFRGWGQPMAA